MEHWLNSLGNRSDRNISIKYRSCHPSYIGKLDLNSCSSSSPGLSGVVSPFATTDELWFNSVKEAENTEYEIYKAQKEYFNKHNPEGHLQVTFDTSSPAAYYDAKMKTRKNLDGCVFHTMDSSTLDDSHFYPENPEGDLRINFDGSDEEFMKPIIL